MQNILKRKTPKENNCIQASGLNNYWKAQCLFIMNKTGYIDSWPDIYNKISNGTKHSNAWTFALS